MSDIRSQQSVRSLLVIDSKLFTNEELLPVDELWEGEPGLIEVELDEPDVATVHLRHVNDVEATMSASATREDMALIGCALIGAASDADALENILAAFIKLERHGKAGAGMPDTWFSSFNVRLDAGERDLIRFFRIRVTPGARATTEVQLSVEDWEYVLKVAKEHCLGIVPDNNGLELR